MPLTINHAALAASIVAIGVGTAAMLRQPAPPDVATAPAESPLPPPSRCTKACADLAAWCANGGTVNCVERLTAYEREGKVKCGDGLSADELKAIGWCGSGADVPLVGGEP